MSPSITHLNVLTKRYQDLLTAGKQDELLDKVFELQGHSLFHLKVYFQEWLTLGVIKLPYLLEWAIAKTNKKFDFSQFEQVPGLGLTLLVPAAHQPPRQHIHHPQAAPRRPQASRQDLQPHRTRPRQHPLRHQRRTQDQGRYSYV